VVSTYAHEVDLDPSLVERHTYSSRRRRHLADAGAMISATLALAILVRADLVIPQMPAGLGRPAMILGLGLALGWLLTKLHPRLAVRGPQPLRWAAAAYLGAIGLAYAAGYLRGLPPLEAGAADRALIATIIFLGVALACADGLPNRTRLDDLLRGALWLGAIMATIGIAQFATGLNIVDFMEIPGLVNHHGEETGISFRDRGDGLFQVASTARHYIEFSAVMAMALPIGIHFARFNRSRPGRQWAFLATIAIATAIPLTLARTGTLAAFVGLLVLAPFWTWRMRFNIAVLSTWLLAAIMVIRPGVLGTIRSLFSNLESDPSIEGRTEDYDTAARLFAERPWLGRGPGTFIPTLYQWVDNEWLLHIITTGIIGTGALVAWHVTAITLAGVAYRRAGGEEDRHLCACLISVQVMAMLMAGTYDAMSFTTHVIVLAVLTGATGAIWRFTHPARRIRSAAPLPIRTGPAR
jgi:O-antigen ligase